VSAQALPGASHGLGMSYYSFWLFEHSELGWLKVWKKERNRRHPEKGLAWADIHHESKIGARLEYIAFVFCRRGADSVGLEWSLYSSFTQRELGTRR
jgi:hypothetical protein